MNASEKKKSIDIFLKQEILISPDLLEDIEKINPQQLKADNLVVLNKETSEISDSKKVNWLEIEKSKVMFEKKSNSDSYAQAVQSAKLSTQALSIDNNPVKIQFSYRDKPKKREYQDFVAYLHARFRTLEGILLQRTELQRSMSISRLKPNQTENVTLIGMVQDLQETKNKNKIIVLEDLTGTVKVIVSKSNAETYSVAQDLVVDEVIGLKGTSKGDVVFGSKIFHPDVPFSHPLRKSPNEGYAAFLSDLHFGSAQFLAEEFDRFLKWINQETGTDKQKGIAAKIKYIFITGDLVDGIGVYQGQLKELSLPDVRDQYKACADALDKIPKHIKIIVCPGNHDALRISEPQPAFNNDYAGPLLKLENVIAVSNPGVVNIDSSEGFPGLNVLVYHGYSFDYYIANVESIRKQGGYDRADLIVKFLLERRHLAPSHSSTLHMPDPKKDNLCIDPIPDIIATGHVHRTSVSQYRNISLINGSCWQGMTAFQERLGHNPQPARVPILNLQTRTATILKFG